MAAQKRKRKIVGRNFLHFWMSTNPKPKKSRFTTLLILPDHMGDCFRKVFLPENDFQTSSTVNFPEKLPEFGALKTNQRHKIPTSIFSHTSLHINSTEYKNCFGHLIRRSSKCHKFWGQN